MLGFNINKKIEDETNLWRFLTCHQKLLSFLSGGFKDLFCLCKNSVEI